MSTQTLVSERPLRFIQLFKEKYIETAEDCVDYVTGPTSITRKRRIENTCRKSN